MLRDKKIILGVCGSIAAYKAAYLVRLLIKEGAEVQVIMTTFASEFITPLTLSTLSQRPILTDFSSPDNTWNNHVALGLWADHLLIAPASAHTVAKMVHGLCDNLLTAVYLSARCPVTVAPAMDLDMYLHGSTVGNLEKLKSYGNYIIDAEYGELASGLSGQGRMAEPENIVSYLRNSFVTQKKLSGKRVLITAGPTYESIDPVRFIGNYSTGKMGYALARQAEQMGAEVILISGPSHLRVTEKNIQLIPVQSAAEMHEKVEAHFTQSDIIILAAAVADYRPAIVSEQKIKKKESEMNLALVKTVDIAAALGKKKRAGQLLAGFALETSNEIENAKEKLKNKNLDIIVLNSLNERGAGFGHDTNKITILYKNKDMEVFTLKSKDEAASDILNALLNYEKV